MVRFRNYLNENTWWLVSLPTGSSKMEDMPL